MHTTYSPLSKAEKIVFFSFTALLVMFAVFLVIYHINDYSFYNDKGGCGMKIIFHLYCPGCGGTRAVDYLLHGRFVTSFLYHPVVLFLACYFLSYYIPALFRIIGIWKAQINNMIYVYILIAVPIIIILNCIIRNLLMVYAGMDYIGDCLPYWT